MLKILIPLLFISFLNASDLSKLEEKASAGMSSAQLQLGKLYLLGNLVDKDETKAFQLIESAAKKGNIKAKYYLGFFYEKGIGTEQDYELAIDNLKEASKQGEAEASYLLGTIYQFGENKGISITTDRIDKSLAITYYKLAIKQGKELLLFYKDMESICLEINCLN